MSITGLWAVSESEGVTSALWEHLPRVSQGNGALGHKLDKVYRELMVDYDIVLFMGADSPHINIDDLYQSINKFSQSKNEFLMGKTEDGGFYLFGGKETISPEIWKGTTYSTEQTAQELSKSLENIGSVSYIDKSFDIDTYDDFKVLKSVDSSHLLKEQKELINWVKSVLSEVN